MKDQMVAVDQAANIGIQFQGERPSGPAFIIWSIPTKRTLADAAGKAGNADNGPIGAALTARSSNYFPRSQATKATGAGMGPWDPLRHLSNRVSLTLAGDGNVRLAFAPNCRQRAAKRNNKPRSNYLARYGGMDHSVAGEPTRKTASRTTSRPSAPRKPLTCSSLSSCAC
jgi:hypothetical protein